MSVLQNAPQDSPGLPQNTSSPPAKTPTTQYRLSARERIAKIIDEDSFDEWDKALLCNPPFPFPVYEDRLIREQEKTQSLEAVCCGSATIEGHSAAIVSMDPFFLMGSMGSTVGERIARAIDRAGERKLPLIVFSSSGGARMQEGLGSLLQMAKLSCALANYAERSLLYISVQTDPTTGGVLAALSSQGDIILAEKGSQIGFTGRRVIETTFRPQFPSNFQSAEFALTHGLVDAVVPRAEMRATLAQLLAVHHKRPAKREARAGNAGHSGLGGGGEHRNHSGLGGHTDYPAAPVQPLHVWDMTSAWDKVCLARKMDRPTSRSYIREVVTDFVELHGDRNGGDDKAIIAGLGHIGTHPVTVIAQEKGTNTLERIACGFGCVRPEGYRKVIRVARQAEKFNRPIICFVDTQGAHCGVESEEHGQGNAIGDCLLTMSNVRVPVISVILGEGGSGGALAMALANSIGMLENAIYSICSPEAFATILWKDVSRAPEAAEVMRLTAYDALRISAIDEVIPEPSQGAHGDPVKTAEAVLYFLVRELDHLTALDPEVLVRERQQRFRDFLRSEEHHSYGSNTLDFKLPSSGEQEFSRTRSIG
jgi:acetyl-CoA carboxylase carboxyl transferase subunit beta